MMDTREFDERNMAKSRAVCAAMAEASRGGHRLAACDRDALLSLADECDKAFSVNRASAYDEIARRIREACGAGEEDE